MLNHLHKDLSHQILRRFGGCDPEPEEAIDTRRKGLVQSGEGTRITVPSPLDEGLDLDFKHSLSIAAPLGRQ